MARVSDSVPVVDHEASAERGVWLTLALALVLSLAFHGAVTTVLGWLDPSALAIAPPAPPSELFVETVVEEPEPEPEVEEPEPEPEVEEPEPEPEVVEPEPQPEPVERAPRPNDPAPEPPPQAEEPPPPEPLDLSGTVLTGTGNSDFQVVQGDGSDREGPIGPPPTRRGGSPDGVPNGTGGGGTGTDPGPRVLPLANLSRPPSPPNQQRMNACVNENFPRSARQQSLEGVATVRGRVMPDGSFTRLRIASESIDGLGFGQACLRCLRGQRWTPPLGPNGDPVATDVRYDCSFRIRD
ncbi:MAG: hypothetical protein CMN30_12160 [Sandaracinus sp.]|nr:hypothetical protein [Sandaracinus sp.]